MNNIINGLDNKSVVILNAARGMFSEDKITELESKYTEKFGCTVVILEMGIELSCIVLNES